MMMNKLKISVLAAMMVLAWAVFAFAAATPEEAAQLGKNLTLFGAEAAGNKDGSIPAYTGGLKTPPANYNPGSGFRPDPYVDERPLFSITANNMGQYADKLTDGVKYLLKKWPSSYRLDIYKTHRTCAYPDWVLQNTVKNATKSQVTRGGEGLKDARACIPFPIPKNGHEVMWNHLTHYQGKARFSRIYTDLVDAAGSAYAVSQIDFWEQEPYWQEDRPASSPYYNMYWMCKWLFKSPARKAGEAGEAIDPINIGEQERKAYLYLPGQRRIKLAPQVAFDTPSSDGNGNFSYDETWMFNGSMEKYNVKLIGKKEMYIPYNCYRASYATDADKKTYFTGSHINPSIVRWELHRVWIVELELKPGARSIYKKRRFYVDEDTWSIICCDMYDAAGKLFKINNYFPTQSYDEDHPNTMTFAIYNINNGACVIVYRLISTRDEQPRPDIWWAGDNMLNMGIR